MPEPTRKVRLKESGDMMIINEADFNAELHEPLDGKGTGGGQTRRTATATAGNPGTPAGVPGGTPASPSNPPPTNPGGTPAGSPSTGTPPAGTPATPSKQ